MRKFICLTSILLLLTLVYYSQAGDNRGSRKSRYKIVQGIHYKHVDSINYWVIDTSGGWAKGRKFKLMSDGTLSPNVNPCPRPLSRTKDGTYEYMIMRPDRPDCNEPDYDSVIVVP